MMHTHSITTPKNMPRAIALRALVLTALLSLGCRKDNAVATTDSAASRSGIRASDSGGARDAMADMPGMAMKAGAPGSDKGAGSETAEKGDAKAAIPQSITFSAAQVQHGSVRWAPVTAGSSAGTATMPGELTVNEDRTARLGAPGRGRVLSVRAQPGEVVSRGHILVVIQSAEAGMAQADVAKASAEVTSRRAGAQYAASARARAERLLVLKAIPRQDYERAIADDEQARAALAQATAELQRARSTAEQLGASGASSSGEIVLRAPLAGVVLERTAQPGVVVEAGAPLAVVTDPSSLWLQVKAAEAQAGLFQRGGQLAFRVPAYPAERFIARIDAVGAGLDPATRTLGVRAVVPNAAGRLKPSMLATVEVQGGPRVVAILVPDPAVQVMEGKPTVFIAHPDGKGGARFERRVVELGARGGGQVAITHGLMPGDVVVVAGAFAVKAQLQKGSTPMEM